MNRKVDFTPYFEDKLERLERRYPDVIDEVDTLIEQLEQGLFPGDKIPRVGYDVYKVRMKNRSAGKGKSGGFRAIYYIWRADSVLMITIYSKSDQSDTPVELLRQIIEEYQK